MMPWWGWLLLAGGTWLLLSSRSTASSGVARAIFLHRSVGTGMLQQGLRQLVASYLALWDHGYSYDGLHDAAGAAQPGWLVEDNYTDTSKLLELWTSPAEAELRDKVLAFPTVIVKSCFTNNPGTLAQAQAAYTQLRGAWAGKPNIFVLITQPPLHRLDGDTPNPATARALASWLASPSFLGFASNVFVIDLFGFLAEPASSQYANRLRWEYELSHEDADSHPNAAGYAAAAKFVAAALVDIAKKQPAAPSLVGDW